MLGLIVALFILGILLISFELIVPGGILGLLGAFAILASWALGFVEYGSGGGLVIFGIGLVLLVLVLAVELKFLPRTKVGKRLFLNRSIEATSQNAVAAPDLVGKKGEALTTLAPSGVVLIDDRKYEGFSMSGMVEKGTRIEVVDFDTFRVRVKKI